MKHSKLLKSLWQAAIVLLLSTVPLTANAHDFMVGGLYYTLNHQGNVETAIVTGYDNSSIIGESLVIPASVGGSSYIPGYYVTGIAEGALANCTKITSVEIGSNVSNIGNRAFNGCSQLKTVKIYGDYLYLSFGSNVFSNCKNISTIYWHVRPILDGFDYNSIFLDSKKSIKTIVFGNPVQKIPNNMCSGFENLVNVTISSSVTSIGNRAFNGCGKLTSITIPNTVTSIEDWAFNGCSTLASVTIGNSVNSIGNYAFQWCSSLTNIDIPNSVTTIGGKAFYSCTGLTNVNIGNSVTAIGGSVFEDCTGLTSATIGNSVSIIGEKTFRNCRGLTSITIPNSVISIGNCAFENCSGLTSVTIPNSVTAIGGSVFSGCSSLKSIVVETGNTTYDSRNNCNAIIETATNTLLFGCNNSTIPNSVTAIGSNAFYNCSGISSIFIPNSVTSIGGYAFKNCSGLTSVTIPNSVTSIGEEAFCGCSDLTSVTIGNSVTNIGNYAFNGCTSLTNLYSYINHPADVHLGARVFYKVDKTKCVLHVISGRENEYRNAIQWNDFYDIVGDINENVEADDVEDFETMPTTTNTSAQNVVGRWAFWSFTKCNVAEPGSGLCDGNRAVAMKLPSLVESSDTYYDAYQLSVKVFNQSGTDAKLTLSYSVDGGVTWNVAKSESGASSITIGKYSTETTTWVLSTNKTIGTRYRIQQIAGNKNNPIYIDNITICYTAKGAPPQSLEDFETMPATTNTSAQNVEGRWANWSFTKCNVVAPGSGMCNGTQAVAMKLPSLIECSDTYYDAYQFTAKVFNTTSTDAKLTLSYSVDGGNTWDVANSATGATSITIGKNSTSTPLWHISASKRNPTRYRIQQIAGDRNSPIYIDDIALYYTAVGSSDEGDVNDDGKVNVSDVTALVNMILGVIPKDMTRADVNGDCKVNVSDVTTLINIILGII